ncbi:MAG: sugar phosphate nucleotidyltransferase [Candidatus Bathyarchaeales archaeon]
MKALILAGGFGTRLRPISCTRPKTLFPLLNKPLLQWTLEVLARIGVSEAILAVSRQTEFYIKNSRIPKNEMKIVYSFDPPNKPLGTGGPVKKAEKFLKNGDFLVINGDIFTNLNYSEIIKVHWKKEAVATIALCEVKDPSRFGVAELADDGCIKRFIEKPPPGTAPTNLINAGVYVLSPEILNYIPKGRKVSLEREVFPKLVEKGKLYGYIFDGLWTDIGKAEDYMEINKILLDLYAGEQKFRIRKEVEFRKPVVFDEEFSVGEGSIIGPYAVLGQNVKVGKNVHIKDSIIFPRVSISDSSTINGAIIGENVIIGKGVKIGEKCVIGDHAVIGDNVSLAKGVSICPAKEIFESMPASKWVI